jgi:hypothetical protein
VSRFWLSPLRRPWRKLNSPADEAKALLEKAVAAVKEDKAKAFEMFATGDSGFKPKDLYVWCANALDGILTVHPTNKGKGAPRHQGQARRSLRRSDHAECRRRNDQGDDLLVTASRLGRGFREDDLLHQGRRSGLRRRVLHGMSAAGCARSP